MINSGLLRSGSDTGSYKREEAGGAESERR